MPASRPALPVPRRAHACIANRRKRYHPPAGAVMSDEALIKIIVAALENTLAELVTAEHTTEALNALTEVIVKTLKTAESLSAPQAYRRAAEVFVAAAAAEEAEAAEAAAAKAKQPSVRRVL